MRPSAALRLILVIAGCASAGAGAAPSPSSTLPPGAEAVSLSGMPLVPPAMSPDARQLAEQRLAEARAVYNGNPSDADAIIWLGRRTAYLGRFQEAIAIFTKGIAAHPLDARFYRHRGHRYITARQFGKAASDLARAAELVAGQPDEVEPDGLPNARGIPTSTLQSNIWYHLGLAHYLRGDFGKALEAYRRDLAVATNPDMLVATSHWLYMTLRCLGRPAEAAAVLTPISRDMDIIENGAYHQLLLMYKGEISPDSMMSLPVGENGAINDATVGYGVANWHLYNGRPVQAEQLLRHILRNPQWAAFGFIAAEADFQRLGLSQDSKGE